MRDRSVGENNNHVIGGVLLHQARGRPLVLPSIVSQILYAGLICPTAVLLTAQAQKNALFSRMWYVRLRGLFKHLHSEEWRNSVTECWVQR